MKILRNGAYKNKSKYLWSLRGARICRVSNLDRLGVFDSSLHELVINVGLHVQPGCSDTHLS